VITQLAPAVNVAGQVFVSVNSALAVIVLRVMLVPAVFVSVTVCVLGTPTRVPLANTTLAGLAISAGFTVMLALADVAPVVAVIATFVTLVTAPAVTVKVWLIAPAATSTVEGTGIAPASLLLSPTESPPLGAFPFSTTVPVAVCP